MNSKRRIGWMNVLLAASLCGAVACKGEDSPKVPPGAKGAAVQLAKGDGYRVAWSTPEADTVLALADLNETTREGRLDLLRKGETPTILSQRTSKNVKVSKTVPAKALYMESIGGGVAGTLISADLARGEREAVPGGSNVAVEGFWFGPSSDILVFLSNPIVDPPLTRSTLVWSDGETPKEIGEDVAVEGVVFSRKNDTLVAGVDVNASGVGRLVWVDLKTGESKKIADAVKVLASKSAGFAIDAAGKRVVYQTEDGDVMMWDSGGSSNRLTDSGSTPGVSADGRMVAWFSEGKLVVSGLTGETLSIAGPEGQVLSAQRPPRFSHDNTYVYWFSGGQPAAYNFVADAWVASTTVDAPPVKIGSNVGFDSFEFSTKSPRVAAVVNLENTQGLSKYDALGRLGVGAPDAALEPFPSRRKADKPGGTVPKYAGVYAKDMGILPDSERVAFIEAGKAGSKIGEVYVTNAKPGEDAVRIGTNVMIGSLRVSTTPEFDRIIYTVQSEEGGKGSKALEDGTLHGALYVSTADGPPKFLEEGVVYWELAEASGRAVAVVGKGDKAGVWTYPTAN